MQVSPPGARACWITAASRSVLTVAMVAASMTAAPPAEAHAKLVAANPAAGAVIGSPRLITLRFSERLEPRFSTFSLTGRGVRIRLTAGASNDRRTLVGVPAKPLAMGAYRVSWRAITADSHRIQGAYTFAVR